MEHYTALVSTVVFNTLGNYISSLSAGWWWWCPDIAHFLGLLLTAVSRCATLCWPHLLAPPLATCPVMSPQPAPCTVQTMLETVCSECCSLLCYIYSIYLLCSFSGSCSMYCGAGIQTGVYSTPSTSLASPAHACQVPASHTTVCILTLTHTSHIHQPIPTLTH